MKIYLDLETNSITKIDADVVYQGDVFSDSFELLFANYGNSSWFPTMSQLAPNGREAGDFSADALGVGETREYTEDGITYYRYVFTIGNTWVKMSGRSNFYVWVNTTNPTKRKCIGKINVMINESNDNYFIQDPNFNPAVKTYIDSEVAKLKGGPDVFDTAANIQSLNEDKGLAVATDTGYIYYWDADNEQYVNSNLKYVDLANKADIDGSNVTDFSVGNDLSVGGDLTVTGNIVSPNVTTNALNVSGTATLAVIDSPKVNDLAEKGNAIGRGWADLTRFTNYVKTEKYRIGGYVVGTYEPDYRSNDKCDSVEFDLPHAVLKFKIGTNVFTNIGIIYTPNDKAFLCNQTDSYSYYRIDNGYVYVDCQYFIDNGYTKIALAFDRGDIDLVNVYDDYSDYIYNSTNVVHSNAQLCESRVDGGKVETNRIDFTALSDFNIRYGEYLTGYNVSTYKPTFTINTTLAVAVMEFAIPSNYFWLKMPISDNAIAHTQAVVLYKANTMAVNIVYNNSSLLSLWMIKDGFIYINTQIALSAGYTHIAINIDLDGFYIEDCEKILDKPMYIPMRVFGDFGVVGDSFTRGDAFSSGGTNYIKPNYSWAATIAGRNNMHYSNYGYGGANTRTYFSTEAYTRLMNDDVKPFYIFDLGINDLALGEAYIGTINDIDTNDYTNNADTFYGNYGKLISQVLARNGNARIVLLSIAIPLYFNSKRTAFNTAIKAIATLFNVPYINLEDDGYFHSKVYQRMSTNHPTLVAYGGMGLAIERLISQCILDNQDYFKYVGLEDSTNYFTKYALTGGTGIAVTDNVVSINSTYQTKISNLENSLSTAQEQIADLERENENLKQASLGNIMQSASYSGTAYEYTLDSDTLANGYLLKVGGMSYKSENLIVLSDVAETTTNDVTYSVTDGVITLNGTASANTTINLVVKKTIKAGTYYFKVFNWTTGLGIDYYIVNNAYSYDFYSLSSGSNVTTETYSSSDYLRNLYFVIASGTTLTNLRLKPMLVSGSTAPTEFIAGFSGIRDTAVTSVTNKGANLFNTTFSGNEYNVSATISGLSNNTNYIVKFWDNAVASNLVLTGATLTSTSGYQTRSTFTFTTTATTVVIALAGGSTSNKLNEKANQRISLSLGSTAPTSYLPYRADIVKPIPASVQALDGYGYGLLSSVNNYIDVDTTKVVNGVTTNKTFTKMVARKTLDSAYAIGDTITISDIKSDTTNVLSSEWGSLANWGTISGTTITLTQALTSGGSITYELATASIVTTDISSYLDADFDLLTNLEGNGTLVFDNPYGQEAVYEIFTYEKL